MPADDDEQAPPRGRLRRLADAALGGASLAIVDHPVPIRLDDGSIEADGTKTTACR